MSIQEKPLTREDRPRIRLQSPMVEFKAVGVFNPGEEELKKLQERLPYFAVHNEAEATAVHIYCKTQSLAISIAAGSDISFEIGFEDNGLYHYPSKAETPKVKFDNWTINITGKLVENDKFWLIVNYALSA